MSAQKKLFNDTPILVLQGKKIVLALGPAKAKLVMEHFTELSAFVEETTKVEAK